MTFPFSATQVSMFELCARKWAWRYIEGVKEPPSKAQDFGDTTHQYLQRWLVESVLPPEDEEGKVARVIVPFVPPPQAVDPDNVEMQFYVTLKGYEFTGVVDLFMPKWLLPINDVVTYEVPVALDHKTTSDEKWAMSPEDMPDDVQASLYAYWVFLRTKAPEVGLQWTYGKKRGKPRGWPVRCVVKKEDVEPRLLKTVKSAEEMTLIREETKSALEVVYNPNACEAFGGCGYRDRCNLTARERMSAIMSEGSTKNTFLQRLEERKRKRQQENGGVTAPPAMNPPEGGSAGPPPPEAEAAPPAQAEAPAQAPEPTKTKRKRRTKAEIEGTTDLNLKSAGGSTKAMEGWTLYINCAPVKGVLNLINAEEILGAVRFQEGASYSPGEKTREIFVEAVRERLQDEPPTGDVLLNTSCKEARDTLLVFVIAATRVIQGR